MYACTDIGIPRVYQQHSYPYRGQQRQRRAWKHINISLLMYNVMAIVKMSNHELSFEFI